MIKSKTKKIISSLLVPAILATSPGALSAKSFWDDATFNNFTAPAASTDPNTGITYYSGGSYHVKFKSLGDFPPLFSAQGPDIKVGCRGVSFNLGFGSLINFEQLSNQLSEAGESLAWGLLIGLAYSLPALKQIFDTINEWSAKIQALLANACNFGKMLAQNNSYSKKANKAVKDFAGNVDSTLKDTQISKKLDKGSEWIYNLIKEKKATQTDIDKFSDKLLDTELRRLSSGVVSAYLTHLVNSGIENGLKFEIPSSSVGYSINTVRLEDAGLSDMTEITVYVLLSMISDDYMDNVTKLGINLLIKANNEKNAQKQAAAIKIINEHLDLTGSEKSKYTFLKNIGKSNNALNFLINGSENFNSFAYGKGQPYLNLVSKKYSSGKIDHFVILGSESSSAITALKNWEGLKKESARTVVYVAKRMIGRINGSFDGKVAPKMPFLMPHEYDLLSDLIIALRLKDSNIEIASNGDILYSNMSFVAFLNSLIAENTYIATSVILENLMHNAEVSRIATQGVKGTAKDSVAPDTDTLAKNIKEIEKKIKVFLTELDKKRKDADSATKAIIEQIQLQQKIKEIVGKSKK